MNAVAGRGAYRIYDASGHGDRGVRLERAIGVIYRPETERQSHYFHASLYEQFDAVVHFDDTRAVEPLEYVAAGEGRDMAQTYPTGI